MTKKIDQTLIPDLFENPVKFPSHSLSARENIERQLFAIAKEHAELASGVIDRDDPEKTRVEMKHSIIAIVMSYTALEAASNNLFRVIVGKSFNSTTFEEFDDQGLAKKWGKLAEMAFHIQNPNHNFIPSDEFENLLVNLKRLRHKIIHYKPKPANLETLDRFPDNSPINPEFTLFTSEEATKAIETVRNVLNTFKEVTGYEVPKLE